MGVRGAHSVLTSVLESHFIFILMVSEKNYNRHHRESLELMTNFLKKNGINLKKQYPRIQEFCKLQNLECPTRKECADWIVDLYRSGKNQIICFPARKRLDQFEKEKSTFYDEDIEFLQRFDRMIEHNSEKYVSFDNVYFYLSKCLGYGHREFDDIKRYVKLSDVKKFIETNQPTHTTYLKSIRWKTIKDYVREKFNYTCQKCGGAFADDLYQLHTHHLTYDRLGNENVDTDLILLCAECHRKEHKNNYATNVDN